MHPSKNPLAITLGKEASHAMQAPEEITLKVTC